MAGSLPGFSVHNRLQTEPAFTYFFPFLCPTPLSCPCRITWLITIASALNSLLQPSLPSGLSIQGFHGPSPTAPRFNPNPLLQLLNLVWIGSLSISYSTSAPLSLCAICSPTSGNTVPPRFCMAGSTFVFKPQLHLTSMGSSPPRPATALHPPLSSTLHPQSALVLYFHGCTILTTCHWNTVSF